MAKEALKSVKEAEEKVHELLQKAKEGSKNSKEEAIKYAEDEYLRIIDEAEKTAKETKENAIIEGNLISKPIIDKGNEDASRILKLSDDRLKTAVNIIIKKVVNSNGNS